MMRLVPLAALALLLAPPAAAELSSAPATPDAPCGGTLDFDCHTCNENPPGAPCDALSNCLVYADALVTRACAWDMIGVKSRAPAAPSASATRVAGSSA